MTPAVSVIIPCFNQAQYLPEAIDSVLAQQGGSPEIIVVNDGSTDATAEVAASYGSKIKYIHQPNQGLSAARNTGLRAAMGKFLQFLDSDDYLLPGLYERALPLLQNRADAAAVYCGFQWVDAGGAVQGALPPDPEYKDPFHRLLEGNPWPCHSVIVRAPAVKRAGAFDTSLRSCEDWDLWLRLALGGGKFIPSGGVGVAYRKYAQSMSTHPWRMLETGIKVIARNARRHGNCPQCGISSAKGRSYWRELCFREKLIPQLQSLLDQGRFANYLRGCLGAFGYDAPSAWRGLKLLRHQKRRILAGLAGGH